MKRNAGTVLGSVLKWLVVPVVLAALGFYVVGPRVADHYLTSIQAPSTMNIEPVEDSGPPTTGAPRVEVKTEKLQSSRRRRPSRESSKPAANTVRLNEDQGDPSPEPPSDPIDEDVAPIRGGDVDPIKTGG